ncbi:hypothetical protein SAMN04487968_1219 [Nocardioides terrae]|uniref:Sulfotransferase family protein n=1 Tax=Nocardioides terrae TaxID=574651 RepID=A0A1I1NVQ1_9ACTN|nr:hypothetical protein [Nocardioides terrae]SFD01505.1 hypothetical protein SAMN04487968_1219 [Nocardioides terrae]
MARRVLLHIGTPKTATTYLQDILFRNRDVLAKHGVHYPVASFDDHFRAALDLTRREWGGFEDEVVGDWDALAAQARSLDGTVIISNEILAGATAEQAARARASFGDAEVHLVLTLRDLARQIPAEWQETVKHYNTESYADFLRVIKARDGRSADLFWRVQHVPDILERWAADLPPERVHLVTAPPAGAAPDVMLRRLEEATGIDSIPLAYESNRTNTGLGVAETALIRLVNERVDRTLPDIKYRFLVREVLAHRQLAERTSRTGSPRLALAPDYRPWVEQLADEWIGKLGAAGYSVVGDLEDLRPTPEKREYVDPDHADPRDVLGAAVESILALVHEGSRLIVVEEELREEVHRLRAELDEQRGIPLGRRVREKAVDRLSGSPTGQKALGAYRRARGRSSREA